MAKAIRMFTLAFLTAVGHCQITLYPNGTQSATAISSGCASAVGGSLNCNPYLQALAETNWYGSLNDTALQTSVCTSGCNTSLSTYHTTVSKACANDPQPWDGIPATWAGDILWATYNRTCLKDPTTGKYCTGMHDCLGLSVMAGLSTDGSKRLRIIYPEQFDPRQ